MKPNKRPASAVVKPNETLFGYFVAHPLIVLMVVCFVVYGNSLFNEYSFDDDFAIYNNEFVQKGIAGIPGILTNPYVIFQGHSVDYRPLSAITFALEKQAWGFNPHISHFINLLLYLGCILFLYKVLTKVFLTDKRFAGLSLVITCLYAVHPAHTEVVDSLKNREELLSLLFGLASFFFAYKYFAGKTKRWKHAVLALLFLVLSLSSKTITVTLVIAGVLWFWFKGYYQKDKKKFLLFSIPWVLLSFAYLLLIVLNSTRYVYSYENPLAHFDGLGNRLGLCFSSLWFYFKFMWVPYPMSFYYGYNIIPLQSITSAQPILSGIFHLGLLVYGIVLFQRKNVAGYFILGYFICMILYMNLLMPYTGIVSERSLFQSSIFFIAAAVILIYEKVSYRKLLPVAGVVVFLFFSGLTFARNFDWKNVLTLMGKDIPHLENSTLANFSYGINLKSAALNSTDSLDKKLFADKAKNYLAIAAKNSPAFAGPYYQLGNIYEYIEQKHDSAFGMYLTGYNFDTTISYLNYELGRSYVNRGEFGEAASILSPLYKTYPNDTLILYYYARTLIGLGRDSAALIVNNQLYGYIPNSPLPLLNNAYYFERHGDLDRSMDFYEQALVHGSKDMTVYKKLVNYYLAKGNTGKLSYFSAVFHSK